MKYGSRLTIHQWPDPIVYVQQVDVIILVWATIVLTNAVWIDRIVGL